jgi:hypothetical protein
MKVAKYPREPVPFRESNACRPSQLQAHGSSTRTRPKSATFCVYKNTSGWDWFEPALSRAERMAVEEIWRIATEIPEEWYDSAHCGLDRLVENLYRRRGLISNLIAAFRTSSRNPFPDWREDSSRLNVPSPDLPAVGEPRGTRE